MPKYIAKAVHLANRLGHKKCYSVADFEAFVPLSDGCSGGLSKVYAKMGKAISCQ